MGNIYNFFKERLRKVAQKTLREKCHTGHENCDTMSVRESTRLHD